MRAARQRSRKRRLNQSARMLATRAQQTLASIGLLRKSARAEFGSAAYVRHNQRRLEHLASLGLPLCGRSVLEVGAGIGDHTSFFLDRSCVVTITDARPENVRILRRRYPGAEIARLDLENPSGLADRTFEVVYCYGTLYHLGTPDIALRYLAERCSGQLLLETCVSKGVGDALNLTVEKKWMPSQAYSGFGCRPTRSWVFRELSELFPHVYSTRTQPAHEEFPLDWSGEDAHGRLTRAIFVASRERLESDSLIGTLPQRQVLCA
jgi:2-polyprenyl-3-methyl-5-hydroxy-6-metoxy-1,4-benzoquinol methylase